MAAHDLAIRASSCTVTVMREDVSLVPGTGVINDGDVLTVNAEALGGHATSSLTLNGAAIENGDTHTVAGDVLVVGIATCDPTVVGPEYLEKIRRGVRHEPDTDVDAELTDLIVECRLDLINLNVREEKACDEADALILGAVRCFARWKFGLGDKDAVMNREGYEQLRDELRKRVAYCTTPTR